MAHTDTSTSGFLLITATLFLVLGPTFLDASPYPKKVHDLFQAHRDRHRRDVDREPKSWRYTRHAIDVLKADLNNNDLYFCRGDPFRGVQCPEEPFCSAWDQICDGEQLCALETREQCLNRSISSYGRLDSRLCDGDENPKWCHWKYQAPVRCGEDIYLSPKKKKYRVQSPRYPDNYPNDYFCFWTVAVPDGHKIAVNFMRFDTEPNYDLLSLGTGYNRESSRTIIIFKHSGKRGPQPSQFDVNSNVVWITFKSDDWESSKGFVIEFTDREKKEFGVLGVNPFNSPPNRDCGGKILMPAEGETRLNSPGFPEYYGNHMECEWVVSIAEGLRIRIHFERFDVEEEEDHLSVGNGVSSRRAPILYKYSSRTKPSDIISRGSDIWFKFVSSVAVSRRGFEIVLTEQPTNDCGGIFTVPTTGKLSIASPDYPNEYPTLTDCLWQFRSASERRIHIGFTEFHTEYGYDRVQIGNGFEPNVNMTNLVLQHSGDNMLGIEGMLAFQSSGPVAWLSFKTDEYNQRKGFRFNVYSEEGSPWIVESSVTESSLDSAGDSEIPLGSESNLELQLQDQEIDPQPNTPAPTPPRKKGGKKPKKPKKPKATTEVPTTEGPTTTTKKPKTTRPPTTTVMTTKPPTTTPKTTTVAIAVEEKPFYESDSLSESSDYESRFSISSSQ
ncbi:bone morphogenetic protein 1-like [Asterias rubens]|uniref:bone morphogenetic protein 1-like n=1 Tax=Asterias rubens TaxID=7604 RepID=UPI001454E536|nr:bone morphogenetic protein 1-like [Asterias rubens]